jgi:hypothetical protein
MSWCYWWWYCWCYYSLLRKWGDILIFNDECLMVIGDIDIVIRYSIGTGIGIHCWLWWWPDIDTFDWWRDSIVMVLLCTDDDIPFIDCYYYCYSSLMTIFIVTVDIHYYSVLKLTDDDERPCFIHCYCQYLTWCLSSLYWWPVTFQVILRCYDIVERKYWLSVVNVSYGVAVNGWWPVTLIIRKPDQYCDLVKMTVTCSCNSIVAWRVLADYWNVISKLTKSENWRIGVQCYSTWRIIIVANAW